MKVKVEAPTALAERKQQRVRRTKAATRPQGVDSTQRSDVGSVKQKRRITRTIKTEAAQEDLEKDAVQSNMRQRS